MRQGPLGAVPGVALLLVALAGCTPLPGGPAQFGGDAGELCLSLRQGETMVVGDVLGTPSSLTLTSVTLLNPHGIELDAAYVLPIVDNEALGSTTFPPTLDSWSERQDPEDSDVEGGDNVNIVVVVTRASKSPATADGIRVEYRSGGLSYYDDNSTALVLRGTCA